MLPILVLYAILINMLSWEEKRKKILARDNFTCQSCGQFNPELGAVELVSQEYGLEIHEYFNHPDPLQNEYRVSCSKIRLTFQINFGNCWPVFPILQVHHKKYITGRERWEYEDEDLITLCKSCHTNLHLNNSIPIYSNDTVLLEERMFLPVDTGSGRKHHCDDWTFIQQAGGGEYVVSNINPTVRFVLFRLEDKERAEREAKNIVDKLIRTYFPQYSK